MSKVFNRIVTCCPDCPCCIFDDTRRQYRCFDPGKADRSIMEVVEENGQRFSVVLREIPNWCPLPEAPIIVESPELSESGDREGDWIVYDGKRATICGIRSRTDLCPDGQIGLNLIDDHSQKFVRWLSPTNEKLDRKEFRG